MASFRVQSGEPAMTGRRRLSDGELNLLLDNHARFLAGKGGKKSVRKKVNVGVGDGDLAPNGLPHLFMICAKYASCSRA